MSKSLHLAIALAPFLLLAAALSFGYELAPVTIQKDQNGRLTAESVSRLEHVRDEIEEHGTLRVWVEGEMNYRHLEPGDPGYESQERQRRRLLEGIVARLANAMSDIAPAEQYTGIGPYVAVSASVHGLEQLVDDPSVRAFFVLVPSY